MTPYELHRKKWSTCERCPLCETRKNVVLVRGKLPCDVLMVGEAPGINEDALGKPFVGPAGKLLDKIIDQAGGNVPRVRIAFTNVIACIPYDDTGKKVSDPPKEAVKRCNSRVMEVVHMARPSKIVCVGVVANKHFSSFTQGWHGEVFTITHPAAILRAAAAVQGIMYQKCVVQLSELFESLIPF